MLVKSLTLKNVRGWKDATIPLSPFTVIVGPNASGKTTILEALQFLARRTSVAFGWKGVGPGASELLLRRGASELTIQTEGDVSLQLSARSDESTLSGSTPVKFEHTTRLIQAKGNDSLLEDFATLRVLRLDANHLADPSYSDDEMPRVAENGANLATVIAYLKQEAPEVFLKIENALRRILPDLETIRAPRAKVLRDEVRTIVLDGVASTHTEPRTYVGNELRFDMRGARDVGARYIGEGSLLSLGLLTALGGIDPPGMALLDDIDMRLHPRAQSMLVQLIREMMMRGATRQFIGTTHSPFFLQHLQPEEVVVVASTPEGSVAQRLDAHPEYAKWKDAMGVGEFWTWAGEQWLSK